MRSSLHGGALARLLAKSLLSVAAAALLAGCSNSIERFSEAYNNPSDADPVYTASVPKPRKVVAAKPRTPVYQAPSYDAAANDDVIEESPVSRASIPQAQAKPYDYSQGYKPAYKQARAAAPKPKLVVPQDDTYDTAQDEPVQDAAPAAPVRVKPARVAAAAPAIAPKAGGARVRVENGMTMYSIARANGVSVQELAAANNMEEPYQLQAGQSLRIPGASTARVPQVALNETSTDEPVVKVQPKRKVAAIEDPVQPAAKPARGGASYTVANGDTLYSIGRKFGVSPYVIADANGLKPDQQLSLGKTLRIPGAKSTQTAAANMDDTSSESVAAPAKKKKAPLSLAEDEAQNDVAADDSATVPEDNSAQTAKAQKPAAATADDTAGEQMAAAPVSPSGLSLRWPLKGKVISGFGSKPNGLKNEGINIAVPEGTSVRAAEGGVVAYAGNELKGYGNLVLIRHTGGYVTAYAHAKELFVKRGDTVTRGQVIAKAGQTGAVSSPQLHFEVRKGATALDPMKFMTSATASN